MSGRLPLPKELAALLPEHAGPEHNPGLFLDRFLPRDPKDWSFTGELRVAALRPYARLWSFSVAKEVLERRAGGCRRLVPGGASPSGEGRDLLLRLRAKTNGKLLLNSGRASGAELSVSLHPLWQVPFLAGSGLKGLCRAEAELAGPKVGWTEAELSAVFGRQPDAEGEGASAGLIDFPDALPEDGRYALVLDTLTPHHSDWYGGQEKLPVEWEAPVPWSFLAVASATFAVDLIARARRDEPESLRVERLKRVAGTLSEALRFPGFGAKTAAGYGSFEVLD